MDFFICVESASFEQKKRSEFPKPSLSFFFFLLFIYLFYLFKFFLSLGIFFECSRCRLWLTTTASGLTDDDPDSCRLLPSSHLSSLYNSTVSPAYSLDIPNYTIWILCNMTSERVPDNYFTSRIRIYCHPLS